MIQEEIDSQRKSDLLSRWMRHRLPYPAIAIALTLFAPGFVILLYLLSWGWGITAPPFSYDYRVEFTWYRFWTPLASVLIGASAVFVSGYAALWLRKPKWNIHLVAVFSWFNILFGIGYTIWILVFAFVIPTGVFFWDGPSGGGSGHTHDSPFPLVISLSTLGAGIYGLSITRWIRKNPQKAHPSDVRDRPNHLSKKGWAYSVLAVIVGIGVVFGLLLNPSLSPLTYVHDRDGDGIADMLDHFPDDPNLWKPMSLSVNITGIDFFFYVEITGIYTDDQLPLVDFYLTISHPNGTLGFERVMLGEIRASAGYHDVVFVDRWPQGYLSSRDYFWLDRTVYEAQTRLLLSDSRGDVIYMDYLIQVV